MVAPGANPSAIALAVGAVRPAACLRERLGPPPEGVGPQGGREAQSRCLATGREPPTAHRDAPLQIAADGDLVIPTESGKVRFQRPLIYQEGSGGRREIPGGYVLKGAREVAFKVGAYDPPSPS